MNADMSSQGTCLFATRAPVWKPRPLTAHMKTSGGRSLARARDQGECAADQKSENSEGTLLFFFLFRSRFNVHRRYILSFLIAYSPWKVPLKTDVAAHPRERLGYVIGPDAETEAELKFLTMIHRVRQGVAGKMVALAPSPAAVEWSLWDEIMDTWYAHESLSSSRYFAVSGWVFSCKTRKLCLRIYG